MQGPALEDIQEDTTEHICCNHAAKDDLRALDLGFWALDFRRQGPATQKWLEFAIGGHALI